MSTEATLVAKRPVVNRRRLLRWALVACGLSFPAVIFGWDLIEDRFDVGFTATTNSYFWMPLLVLACGSSLVGPLIGKEKIWMRILASLASVTLFAVLFVAFAFIASGLGSRSD